MTLAAGSIPEVVPPVSKNVKPVRSNDPLPVTTTLLPICSMVAINAASAHGATPMANPSAASAPTPAIFLVRTSLPPRVCICLTRKRARKYCALGEKSCLTGNSSTGHCYSDGPPASYFSRYQEKSWSVTTRTAAATTAPPAVPEWNYTISPEAVGLTRSLSSAA
jgi:hypothetical protein